jgi:hypothetical protein
MSVCDAWGDVHHVTFDRRAYNHQECGTYVLTRLPVGFEVQTRTYRWGSSLSVNGQVAIRCEKEVLTVDATASGSMVVNVNGSPAVSTTQLNSLVLDRQSLGTSTTRFTVDCPAFNTSVRVDASHPWSNRKGWLNVYVYVPTQQYAGRPVGLCGNMNSDRSDEFGGMSPFDFAESWNIEPSTGFFSAVDDRYLDMDYKCERTTDQCTLKSLTEAQLAAARAACDCLTGSDRFEDCVLDVGCAGGEIPDYCQTGAFFLLR